MQFIRISTILMLIFYPIRGNPKRPFHSTPDREKDMIHMKLDIAVDIQHKEIKGKVSHTFTPFSGNAKRISFDTETTEIHSVSLGNTSLQFTQSESEVQIDLDKGYDWEDTLTIVIDFTSHPTQGFYFIKPDSAYPGKKLQGWTQGEDTDNHCWVPLYDYPNDKMTWECIISVEKSLTAISNGELVSVKKKGNRKIFHWRENIPNVSYLLSIAVGEYIKIKDEWDGIPVNYWVYEEHDKEDALRSFGRTPLMMEYFSEITGVRYPFEKYDQTIIEDFMWGGMENVTSTHQSDRTMHEEKERPIKSSDGLVAHELAHQWYGDFITTRNWANAWLNEGFATYLELVWTEYFQGNDLAEFERLENLDASLRADKSRRRPTVQPYYYNSMELFDSNIYAKGSVILNMLRRYLGDDAFFRGIKHYTRIYGGKNVETDDLKKAFEEATGKNLFWFFDQWVYNAGVPEIEVKTKYNSRSNMVTVILTQTQNTKTTSVFKLPMTLLIDDGTINRHKIFVEDVETVYTFPSAIKPKMIIVDEGFQIPKRIEFDKKVNELLYQMKHAPSLNDRIWAIRELKKFKYRKKIHTALIDMLKEENKWYVQKAAVETYKKLKPRKGYMALIEVYSLQDDRVKNAIISALKEYEHDDVKRFLIDIMHQEENDYIVSSAITSLIKVNIDAAKLQYEWAMNKDSYHEKVRKAMLKVLTEEKNEENLNTLKAMAKYGEVPYNVRPTVFDQLAQYTGDYPELIDLFDDYIDDPNRSVRWTCADQIFRRGNLEQFNLALNMVNTEPLKGNKIPTVYDILDNRLEELGNSFKNKKKRKEVEKMLEIFGDESEIWISK